MLGWVLLAFIALPFVELWLLIQIGERIGLWPTLYIVLGTGLLGGILARYQGAQAWREIFGALREGRTPKRELAAGALFLFGAALLLTPGVITDAFGFLMMVPPARRALGGYLIARVADSDRVQTHVSVGGFGGLGGGPRRDHDLDTTGYTKSAEDERLDEPEEPGEQGERG